jgi:hypothetical protein
VRDAGGQLWSPARDGGETTRRTQGGAHAPRTASANERLIDGVNVANCCPGKGARRTETWAAAPARLPRCCVLAAGRYTRAPPPEPDTASRSGAMGALAGKLSF